MTSMMSFQRMTLESSSSIISTKTLCFSIILCSICLFIVKTSGFQQALLHHSRKEQAVTDGICYKIDI
ncbi:Hypothetical protein WP1200 [Wolbachia endosymbiont of Culex quinquefasciatus Pel]|nr:Hypothetical protein WP1200 [Wolbachia endosymbiont of Culex quinquefasciatus Pel]